MKFKAKIVEVDAALQVAHALFADHEPDDDQPRVLMFSRDLSIPNSAYYFEVNDQSYGSYRGLKLVQLSRDGIVAILERELVEKFGEPDFARVEAQLKLDDKTYAKVKDVLEKIFALDKILKAK